MKEFVLSTFVLGVVFLKNDLSLCIICVYSVEKEQK